MKSSITVILVAILAAFALASEPLTNQIIVSYPKGTPPSVLDQAKKAVLDAGGVLIYEYTLIEGFAAKVSAKIMDDIRTLGANYNVLIEQDQVCVTKMLRCD
ncbi:hypothetical protein AC579_3875 [Pseudocercospora musae]|uniref:Inhibitor I9 domain-containing protein n=1 Tax=Pseudocercospora musae TaxID=113226 RepID=A0A139IS59_9PEZI|nr:hypothetical protein AC579_3875 [Pseudocercospora musae]